MQWKRQRNDDPSSVAVASSFSPPLSIRPSPGRRLSSSDAATFIPKLDSSGVRTHALAEWA